MKTVLFEEWAGDWLAHKKNYVKESTYANYLISYYSRSIKNKDANRPEFFASLDVGIFLASMC